MYESYVAINCYDLWRDLNSKDNCFSSLYVVCMVWYGMGVCPMIGLAWDVLRVYCSRQGIDLPPANALKCLFLLSAHMLRHSSFSAHQQLWYGILTQVIAQTLEAYIH